MLNILILNKNDVNLIEQGYELLKKSSLIICAVLKNVFVLIFNKFF